LSRFLAAAAVLGAALAASCAPKATDPVPAPPRTADAPPLPTRDRIVASERARVGGLRVLHARGVAELRWSDAQGDHFEQGDADLRWCAGRGIAVSVSKLGDRHLWVGSDGARWWRFDLKSSPTRLVTGRVAGAGGDAAQGGALHGLVRGVPGPRALGLLALEPSEGAVATERDGVAWFAIPPEGAVRAEAGFDPRTLSPVAVRMVAASGASLEVTFSETFGVDTAGAAPGAWPRIPRRVRLQASGVDGPPLSLQLALDVAVADAEAAGREVLYDLEALRERFMPESVEEDR
jgi:hypothetical protein